MVSTSSSRPPILNIRKMVVLPYPKGCGTTRDQSLSSRDQSRYRRVPSQNDSLKLRGGEFNSRPGFFEICVFSFVFRNKPNQQRKDHQTKQQTIHDTQQQQVRLEDGRSLGGHFDRGWRHHRPRYFRLSDSKPRREEYGALGFFIGLKRTDIGCLVGDNA